MGFPAKSIVQHRLPSKAQSTWGSSPRVHTRTSPNRPATKVGGFKLKGDSSTRNQVPKRGNLSHNVSKASNAVSKPRGKQNPARTGFGSGLNYRNLMIYDRS